MMTYLIRSLRRTFLTENLTTLMLLWRWGWWTILYSLRVHILRLSWDRGHLGMVLLAEEGAPSEAGCRVRVRGGQVWWGQTLPSATSVTPASTASLAGSRPSRTGSPRTCSALVASPSSLTTPSHPLSTATSTQTISVSQWSSIQCKPKHATG